MGGKPSKGTAPDKRLKENKENKVPKGTGNGGWSSQRPLPKSSTKKSK